MSNKNDVKSPLAELTVPKQQALAKPSNFKAKKRLTLDVQSISKVKELLCQCTSELYLEEMPSKFAENGKAQAYCVDVVDLLRSEEFMLICNAILARSLQRAGEPLAGRYFAIQVGDIAAGKTYRKVDVVELDRVG